MTHYDYKVVPAPRRARKIKGVRSSEDLFALTLTEAINEVARQGWEYLRAEHMPAVASRGWLRSAVAEELTLLVFRRPRETLGPRLAAVEPDPAEAEGPRLAPAAERAVVDRMRRREPAMRLEPVVDDLATAEAEPGVLRPGPRLGPADQP
jgi:hypothetical protein